MEQISFSRSFFPTSTSFLSSPCVCLLYCDPLTVDCPSLFLYSLPAGCRLRCVFMYCVCTPSNPIGACIPVWPSLPDIVMPALCLCCVFIPMNVYVYNTCMSECVWAWCVPYVRFAYSMCLMCVCECVFNSFLPRPGSSLCLSIVSSIVFSGFGHLAAIEDNAERTIVGQ